MGKTLSNLHNNRKQLENIIQYMNLVAAFNNPYNNNGITENTHC